MNANQQPVIVTSRALPPLFITALTEFAEVRDGGLDASTETLAGADVYLAAGVDPVPATLIERFPETLGLVANIATGTDNIDLPAATARGIAVSNTPVVAEDTADLAFALILAACRKLTLCERELRAGNWAAGAAQMGRRVHGKTLGIVGLGAIGQAVARRAAGFGMTLLYHGPRPKPEAEAALGARYCADLGELLSSADVVSLNCPLTADNRHLINADTLAQMKAGAILVNTGRGPLVDEQALVNALRSGHLGGAGLDVFEFEPEINAGLLELDNVTLLPHIGSATGECRMDMALRALANIRQFLDQGQPQDLCNRP